MKKLILILTILTACSALRAQQAKTNLSSFIELPQLSEVELNGAQKLALKLLEKESVQENPRLVSILLTLALGPFGAHRIYLGTDVKVPVFYTLTLGGGLGILPVIDLLHLVFTKDISVYYNNPRIFMWSGNKE
ncbi:NINE protein [Halocola ammonii]